MNFFFSLLFHHSEYLNSENSSAIRICKKVKIYSYIECDLQVFQIALQNFNFIEGECCCECFLSFTILHTLTNHLNEWHRFFHILFQNVFLAQFNGDDFVIRQAVVLLEQFLHCVQNACLPCGKSLCDQDCAVCWFWCVAFLLFATFDFDSARIFVMRTERMGGFHQIFRAPNLESTNSFLKKFQQKMVPL